MKIGFNKRDITPMRPCHMAGYSRKKMSESVLDPIQVNTLSFEIESESFILIELDSIMLEQAFCERVKARVTQATGVDANHVVAACIHTHSAPAFFKLSFEDTNVEPELTTQAEDAMVQSATAAFAHMQSCSVTFEKMQVEGLYGNRNVKGGVEDKNCYLVSFFDAEGDRLGALFNISAHPTILNGSSLALSADLIGQVRLRLEAALGCPVVCTNGTCGDVSTRFYRKASGMEELMGTAQALFDQLMAKKQRVELRAGGVASGKVEMPTVFDARTDPDFQAMTAAIEEEAATAPTPLTRFYLDRQQLKLDTSPIRLVLISQYYVFGNVIVVTLPGDTCSELGRRIKSAFPGHEVIIIGYANTYCNYLVPDCDYGKYFETFNSRTARGESDRFIAMVTGSLKILVEQVERSVG